LKKTRRRLKNSRKKPMLRLSRDLICKRSQRTLRSSFKSCSKTLSSTPPLHIKLTDINQKNITLSSIPPLHIKLKGINQRNITLSIQPIMQEIIPTKEQEKHER
jgi:hypothetical protein